MELKIASQRFRHLNSAKKTEYPLCPTSKSQVTITHKVRQRMVSAASSVGTVTSHEDYDTELCDVDPENASVNSVLDRTDTEQDSVPVELNATRKNDCSVQEDNCNGDDEECPQYEILLWSGSSLGGVEFALCEKAGYPFVKVATGNESLPGMWNIQEGDFLVAMNDCNTHISAMEYDLCMQVVANGARPLVLRFRRPTSCELQRVLTRKQQVPSEARLTRRRNRERLEQSLSYVIWREGDGPLGVSLKKKRECLYPVLADMNRTSIVSGHASVGDQLISINQHAVHELDKKRWVQLLKISPKPLVLVFRLTAPTTTRARMVDL